VVLIVVAVGWFSRRRIPSAWTWLAAFGLTLLPVLYFAGITSGFFAERYLYIPSIPITIAAVLFLRRLGAQRAAAITICVVIAFSALTVLRNRDWRDDERLFRSSSAVAPESVAVWNKLGFVYLNQNDNTEAAKNFAEALRWWNDPRSDKAWYQHYQAELGLGIALERQSQRPAAVEHLENALTIFPNGNEANAALGAIRINQNNYSEGMSLLEKAIKLSSADELARDYMGVALLNQHRYHEAAAYFREALTLNPDYTPAKHHLSMALNALGH
jgi:tetratricopeptide (TPR) repeat protein